MQPTISISVETIIVHPRNTEFFDDISGNEYETFRDSIRDEGIITPLIVASDMTLLSGHQRLKAAQDVGLTTVPVIVRDDISDDFEKLKILLITNFGRSRNDDKKQRKIADEYVKLRGNKHGGDRKSSSDNQNLKLTQDDIAKELGVSVPTLNEMLSIERKLTPEIKEILDSGAFTKTTASKILIKLSKEEQKELMEIYGAEIIEGVTQKKMQEFVDKIKGLEDAKSALENQLEEIQNTDTQPNEDVLEIIVERDKLKQDLREQYEVSQRYKKELEEVKRFQRINDNDKISEPERNTVDIETLIEVCENFMKSVESYQYTNELYKKARQQELQDGSDTLDDTIQIITTIRNKLRNALQE